MAMASGALSPRPPPCTNALTYRTAATLLGQMFPVDAGQNPESLRRHTLKVAENLPVPAAVQPATPAEAIVVTLDSTFVRSCEEGERGVGAKLPFSGLGGATVESKV